MRKSALFLAAALSGVMAFAAHAGPLGGLGGGFGGSLGGGLGGGLGGVTGSVNGSLGGQLGAPDLDAEQRAAAQARARARKAQADANQAARAQAIQPGVSGSAGAVVNASLPNAANGVAGQARIVETVAPRVVAAAPVVGLPPIQAQIVRERQSAALVGGGVVVLSAPDAYVYMDRQADDLRRELYGTGVEVRREGEVIVLEMPGDVTFSFNKSNIRPRFYSVLDQVAHTLNDYPATYVDVIGHTDAIGSAAYNQALSERRAGAVADFIEHREEIPARFYVAGRGKFEPIASNATIEGRAANRRVEIMLHPYVGG